MSSTIQLIAGLANPGKDYANTRHNAGAWFVEEIAKLHNASLRLEIKYHGLYGQLKNDHTNACQLLIPTTFMNHSGQAIGACMRYHKLAPASLLVAHDEIDLPVGVVRLKYDGGDGGHNGLKDIIQHLNSRQFYRLRIGVGRPTHKSQDVADYVLEAPSKADKEKIMTAIQAACDVLPLILSGEMNKAMQQLHTETE